MLHEYTKKKCFTHTCFCSHDHIGVVEPTSQSLNIVLLQSIQVSYVCNDVANEP